MAARKTFEVAFEIAGRMGASFQSVFSSTSAQMRSLGSQTVALKGNLRSLDDAYRAGVINAESYRNAQARLKAQLEQTQTAQSKLLAAQSQKNEAARNASQIRGRIVDTAIMATPMVAATKAAIDFETAMGGVAKQVQGARDDNGELTETYYQMQSNVMNLSRELRMMPSVVADTTAAAARMGVQGADALDDFVRMSVQMGVAFEGSGDQIAEAMAKIANIRGIKLDTSEGREQIRDLADTINYLDDQTTAKGPEIIEVLKRISGTAAQSSFSNNELAVLATTMLDLGKTPEIAATGLNALMNRMATAPSQAKSFQEALATLNISARDLQSAYISDSKGTIFGLLDQIKSLDTAQQAEVLTGLFGAEYQDDISALASGIDKLRGNMDLLDESARKGSMEKEFAAKLKLTSSSLDGVKQSIAETSISLTQVFLPSIQQVSGGLVAGAQMLASFRQEHPELTNAIVLTTAGLIAFRLAWLATTFSVNQYKDTAAGIKDILASHNAQMAINNGQMMLSAGASRVATAAQWLFNASLYGCPVVWIVAGVAAIVAAGYLLYQNWDVVKEKTIEVWGAVTAWFGKAYASGVQFITELPGQIAYGVGYAVGFIETFPQRAATFMSEAGTVIVAYASEAANGMIMWVGRGVDSTVMFFTNLPANASAALSTFVQTVGTWGEEVYNSIWNWISQIPNMVTNAISNATSSVSNFIGNIGSSFTAGRQAGGVSIAQNASGGIYSRGAFLTTFAETSAEAAIPLDGSARAVSLWKQAGDILGVNSGGGIVINATFAPVINGGGADMLPELRRQKDEFIAQLQEAVYQQGRVQFG